MFVGIGTLVGIAVILWDNARLSQSLDTSSTSTNLVEQKTDMTLTSPAFADGQTIPVKYTCSGQNINPSLMVSKVPNSTKSLAMVVDDPDAPRGTFTHWIMWNIPPDTVQIPENSSFPGATEGLNDAGKSGYTGPCPPSGEHRYFFTLYALDTIIGLNGQAKKSNLEAAMKGHVISKTTLIGRYAK